MRLTPRSEEVKAVIEILESDEYDSAQAMAKALIKEVAEILSMRDWWAVAHRFAGDETGGLNWGPYSSVTEAQKAYEKFIGAGEARAVKVYSAGHLEAMAVGKKWKGFCEVCHHAKSLHMSEGNSRDKCGLSNCKCPKFKEIK
jgi:hypothetical protein